MKNRQLLILGVLALILAPLTYFITSIVYELPFPRSISEAATIANQTSFILPVILGGLSLFCITYKSKYNSIGDRLCVLVIGIAFMVVSIQPGYSRYIIQEKVGLLAVSVKTSDIIHSVSAIVGFTALLIWQLFYFTKTDNKLTMTKEKKIRNKIYIINGILCIICIILLSYIYHNNENLEFYIEASVLTLAGLSCVIKSGNIPLFRDKK